MRSYGYTPSKLDGSELEYTDKNSNYPKEYKLKDLEAVIDQGNRPICVSAVISDMVNWNLKYIGNKNRLSASTIYDKGPSLDSGMNPKNAFEYLTKMKLGFNKYAIVGSEIMAKSAIMYHGPILVALNVKSEGDEFWNGNKSVGGHAVSFIGWNKDGFILRNSWGISYGDGGYYVFPYSDFNKILECWTLI